MHTNKWLKNVILISIVALLVQFVIGLQVPLRRIDIAVNELITELSLEHTELMLQMPSLAETNSELDAYDLIKKYKGGLYYGIITIGSGNQSLKAIFDSGSTDFIINSDKCSEPICAAHNKYTSNSSNTSHPTKIHRIIGYGTGTIEGYETADNINIFGLEIINQTFVELSKVSPGFFRDVSFDGIIGLGLPGLSHNKYTPVMDSIIDQKLVKNNIVSFYIDRTHNYTSSFVRFGEPEVRFTKNRIDYHKVISERYWQLKIDDILVNNQSTKFCRKNGCKAIIDTGSSVITGPAVHIYTLLKIIDADSDCKNMDSLPSVDFRIGNVTYSINSKDYLLASKDKLKQHFNQCIPGFSALNVPKPDGPTWILGELFLSNYFVILDRDNMRIGFGSKMIGLPIEKQYEEAHKEKARDLKI